MHTSGNYSIPGGFYFFNFPIATSKSMESSSDTIASPVGAIYFSLLNTANPIYTFNSKPIQNMALRESASRSPLLSSTNLFLLW
jgi:hypothetical protein